MPARRRGGSRLAPPVRVRIARLPGNGDLPLPAHATPGAAGFDLAAAVDVDLVVEPGARTAIPTGFCIAVPAGYEAQIRPRSGLALASGIVLPNAPGTIDSDYRGELRVILWNAGAEPFTVRRGDRIAQLVVAPVVRAQWEEVPGLEPTERGSGGFGHTGLDGPARRAVEAGEERP
ncbi:MAG: dUTP diphosphatase [Deltaproteobacteria bacterium]|nr:MAG: dUTP diphosphatase [Deltaproteobacteria bacterium]